MTNLKRLLTQPLRRLPASLIIVFLVIALLGFADAGYLTVEHYKNVVPPCSITGGCEQVLTSAYATVAGVPVSLIGAVYYLLIAIGAFAYLESGADRLFRYGCGLSILGFLASVYFFCVQAFIIHSYCAYCLGSALTSTVLFILVLVIAKKYTAAESTEPVISHVQHI